MQQKRTIGCKQKMSTERELGVLRQALWWMPRCVADTSRWVVLFGYDAIDLGAAYGSGAADGNRFDFDLYAQLLPVDANVWSPGNTQGRLPPLECGPGFPHPNLFLDVADHAFSRRSWLHWFHDGAHFVAPHGAQTEDVLAEPTELMKTGYALVARAGRHHGVESREFAAALAIVGIGALGIVRRRTCQMCFRCAVPGLTRCLVHSQSKVVVEGDRRVGAGQAQSARTARLTGSLLGWPAKRPLSLDWGYTEEWANAGVLWPDRIRLAHSWLKRLGEAFATSIHVRALLPKDFLQLAQADKFSALRRAIDPYEWCANRWPEKICLAEAWLTYEGKVAPGAPPRGLRRENVDRLMRIKALMALGLSKSQIADRLGISRSHMSHLIRRAAESDRTGEDVD